MLLVTMMLNSPLDRRIEIQMSELPNCVGDLSLLRQVL